MQMLDAYWPQWFYTPDEYREKFMNEAFRAVHEVGGPFYLDWIVEPEDLGRFNQHEELVDADQLSEWVFDYLDSNGHKFWSDVLEDKFHEYLISGDDDDDWVNAYLKLIIRNPEANQKIMNAFYAVIGNLPEAAQYYEDHIGARAGGGEHESDIIVASSKNVEYGKLYARSLAFLDDADWGDGGFAPEEISNLDDLITKSIEGNYGGSMLREVLQGVLRRETYDNPEESIQYLEYRQNALYDLIAEHRDLVTAAIDNSAQDWIYEWAWEKAEGLGYQDALSDFKGALGQGHHITEDMSMESIKAEALSDINDGSLDLDDALSTLVEWIDKWEELGAGGGEETKRWDAIRAMQAEYAAYGEAFPDSQHPFKTYYERYDRVVILDRSDRPLADPSLHGATGTFWSNGYEGGYSPGTAIQLDSGQIVFVPIENVALEEQIPRQDVAPGQQSIDPSFVESAEVREAILQQLKQAGIDTSMVFVMFDSIDGMKRSSCLNVAVQGAQRVVVAGQVKGCPLVAHASEDPQVTWRDALYDVHAEGWLIPMRKAIKPEDELHTGDHVNVGLHDHDATIIDKHESGEFSYDQYTYKDDDGEAKTVEKQTMRLPDDNPLRLLPKENNGIVMPKTAAAGGTGYGDFQEKDTGEAGVGSSGDVVSLHPPPDLAPFDPEKDAAEGSPVPSVEHKKTLMKNRIVKDSVAGRKVDILATKIVQACKSFVIRKAQMDQSTTVYSPTPAQPLSTPVHNVPVAGNALGGPYQVNENQQDELDANRSEDENVNRTQNQLQSQQQDQQLQSQQSANDLQQVFQQQKIDEANQQRSMTAKKVQAAKLNILFGSSVGAENPADSRTETLEGQDQSDESASDHGRKVFLHEKYSDEGVQDSATYPSHREEVKPRY